MNRWYRVQFFISFLFCNVLSKIHFDRYLVSDSHFRRRELEDITKDNAITIYKDISTLSECALRSLSNRAPAFYYNKNEKRCILIKNSNFPHGENIPGYNRYISDGKERSPKRCFYKLLDKSESYFTEAKRKCEIQGGYVLKINSEQEAEFVKEMFQGFTILVGDEVQNITYPMGQQSDLQQYDGDYYESAVAPSSLHDNCVNLTTNGRISQHCGVLPFHVLCEFDKCIY
ncbi:uncharacterized protein LOC134229684 [Saccostrea cucullata]|uniref:uncharacterized protein LOC134229684 n=1 Tax=Saccostrea cuccullata TaxID=36930 RepID=UPI002ED55E59